MQFFPAAFKFLNTETGAGQISLTRKFLYDHPLEMTQVRACNDQKSESQGKAARFPFEQVVFRSE